MELIAALCEEEGEWELVLATLVIIDVIIIPSRSVATMRRFILALFAHMRVVDC